MCESQSYTLVEVYYSTCLTCVEITTGSILVETSYVVIVVVKLLAGKC